MRAPTWEIAAAALLWAFCLIGGIGLARWVAPSPVIGFVRFSGPIGEESAAELLELIEQARRDDGVAAVVLELNSPGGLATSSETLFYSLLQLRQRKPLVVTVDGIAVSGAYYMAVAANRLFVPPSGYVGNVGTRGARPTDPELSPDELTSGPFKLAGGSRFDRIRQLDLVKNAFVTNVVHQRSHAQVNPLKLSADEVGEGRIYLGSEAVAVGLADLEGGRSDAVATAAQLARLTGYRLVELTSLYAPEPAVATLLPTPALQSLLENAPPDATFLLDSRIPLPGVAEESDFNRRLEQLRSVDPASLSAEQAAPSQPAFLPQLPKEATP